MIEIPLDDRDAERLPPLHEHFKSFWSDTSQEPRAHYNTFNLALLLATSALLAKPLPPIGYDIALRVSPTMHRGTSFNNVLFWLFLLLAVLLLLFEILRRIRANGTIT